MTADLSELNNLAFDLESASTRVHVAAYDVIKRGSHNVMEMARQLSSGLAHAPAYPRSITYDVRFTADGVEGEIGPDKDRKQGALGNLIEYGSANNPPNSHLGPSLDVEGPSTERYLADVAAGLIR